MGSSSFRPSAVKTIRRAAQTSLLQRDHVLLLSSISLEAFAEGVLGSMLGPILPSHAKSLGASPTVISIMFAAFPLAVLLSSPLFGWLSGRWNRRFVMYIGIVLSGVFSVLFGLIPNLALMCICRFMQGLGSAATWAATYSLLAELYPIRSTHVIGLTETATGVGGMAGPAMAAFLSNAMGFAFPFILIGVLLLSQLPVLPIALSRMQKRLDSTMQLQGGQSSLSLLSSSSVLSSSSSSSSLLSAAPMSRRDYWAQLLNGTLVVCGLSVLMTEMVSLGLTPFYEEHLSDGFDLGGNGIGLVLSCSSISYALLAPAVGWITHKAGKAGVKRVMIAGTLLIGVSTVFMGPPPFLSHATERSPGLRLTLLVLAFVVNGVGTALAFVPTLPAMMASVAHLGPEATGIVSGSFYALFSVGGAAGPFVGEAIMTQFGFLWSAVIFGVAMIVFAPFIMLGRFDMSSGSDAINERRACKQARRRRRRQKGVIRIDTLSPSSTSSTSTESSSSTSSPSSSSGLPSSTVSTPLSSPLSSPRRLQADGHRPPARHHAVQNGHHDTDDEQSQDDEGDYDDDYGDEGDYDDEGDEHSGSGEEGEVEERAWEGDDDLERSANRADAAPLTEPHHRRSSSISAISVSISIRDVHSPRQGHI